MIPLLYIPSFYGDIRLETQTPGFTKVIAEKTTPIEQVALGKLAEHAAKKKWLANVLSMKLEGETVVKADILDVQKFLMKLLKPGRKTVTAVLFSNGSMTELDAIASTTPEPKAAVAVAKPMQGCPAPAFVKAEIKARGVLEVFLTPEQQEDFRKFNRFITIGQQTGHRYMITSRFAKDTLANTQRSLYDLDEKRPYCVHDWSVPAAEEMLALHVLLQCGHEMYCRHLET